MVKKHLPRPLKRFARRAIKTVRYGWRRLAIAAPVRAGCPINIILGAAETAQDGWYSTQQGWLDIANEKHWRNVFHGKPLVARAVAEHVFEHLTPDQTRAALRHIHAAMPPGGTLRIAVPDGYNPNAEYIRHVGVAGLGDDAADHKQLLTVDTLAAYLSEAGFTPTHVEGYDSAGRLHQNSVDVARGRIQRSRSHPPDPRKPWAFPDAHTSLIVDGVRQ